MFGSINKDLIDNLTKHQITKNSKGFITIIFLDSCVKHSSVTPINRKTQRVHYLGEQKSKTKFASIGKWVEYFNDS